MAYICAQHDDHCGVMNKYNVLAMNHISHESLLTQPYRSLMISSQLCLEQFICGYVLN